MLQTTPSAVSIVHPVKRFAGIDKRLLVGKLDQLIVNLDLYMVICDRDKIRHEGFGDIFSATKKNRLSVQTVFATGFN